jgi:transcriptional regulator with XRE-family HTH domain
LDWDEKINQRLIETRKAFGYTQKEFAKGINLSSTYLCDLEANRRRVNDRIIKLISITYGVSDDWLKNGEGLCLNR